VLRLRRMGGLAIEGMAPSLASPVGEVKQGGSGRLQLKIPNTAETTMPLAIAASTTSWSTRT
jgi:hypothetical protein